MKNTFQFSAILTMIVSLLISLVSGYCTVVGMGKVFASAPLVVMFIATVIEIGRVVLLYDLHHFWEQMKFHQKLPGICMLLIAMTLSAMGVYGFFANAHSQRTQDIVPIELEIKQYESEIELLNESIEVNNKQLAQFTSKASDKLTEMGYVTKALNAQKEQLKVTKELYDENKIKQEEIANIKKKILELKLDAEKKAPTLAHIKYYAKLFHVDDEMAIIIFIVMIMLVFDTLAMYLMITSDWITKSSDNFKPKEVIKEVIKENSINNENIDCINDKLLILSSKIEGLNQKPDNNDEKIDNLNEKIFELKSFLEDNTNKIIQSIPTHTIDEDLINRLTEIESKLNQKNIECEEENSVLLSQIVENIDNNEDYIKTEEFEDIIKSNPTYLHELKETYKKVPSVTKRLSNFSIKTFNKFLSEV